MKRTVNLWAKAAALAGAVAAAGCQTVPTLPDGRPTTLDQLMIAERAGFIVTAEDLSSLPRYSPVEGCTYTLVDSDPGSPPQSTWDVRPVRDRFLVSMIASDGEASTALIGSDGELFDFNMVHDVTGERVSRDNYQAYAQRRLSEMRTPGSHVINTVGWMTPHYLVTGARYGDVVAEIDDERGGVWARYVYAGTTTYQNRPAVILDLLYAQGQTNGGPIVVGYSVMDRATGLPLTAVLQVGSRTRLQQSGCTSS